MSSLNREILRIAIPSILANITVPLVGMVDLAVAGHLDGSAAAFIGAIAVGSMLFDLLYWNFAFLRAGTGGLTAQAFGRGDFAQCGRILVRGLGLALGFALLVLLIQWPFVKLALMAVDCSPEVRELATQYFFIRIWAAPATISLMAFRGWFIGMQDGVSSMVADLVVNASNIILSLALSLGVGSWPGLGFRGVALGTLIAQYAGLAYAVARVALKYRRMAFEGFGVADVAAAFRREEMKSYFSMNTDLFLRSLGLMGIYIGFTVISARYGDLLLSASAIIMKLLMLFSYFTDGFAYAGEALTGKYIGRGSREATRQSVRMVFFWSMAVGVLFIGIYAFAGVPILHLITSDAMVVETCRHFLPWLILMPPLGCAAFAWDGIYEGATATRPVRNASLGAALSFFALWFGLKTLLLPRFSHLTEGAALDSVASGAALGTFESEAALPGGAALGPFESEVALTGGAALGSLTDPAAIGIAAIHCLMAAYFAHLLFRTVYLSILYRRSILDTPFTK